jgi:hypothetical protein
MKQIGAVTAITHNIFVEFPNEDEANFAENASKKLADEFYNDLADELAPQQPTSTGPNHS